MAGIYVCAAIALVFAGVVTGILFLAALGNRPGPTSGFDGKVVRPTWPVTGPGQAPGARRSSSSGR